MSKQKEGPERDEAKRPRPRGKKQPYPVNDPGFADPTQHPGSEPDYLPGSNPEQKPQY